MSTREWAVLQKSFQHTACFLFPTSTEPFDSLWEHSSTSRQLTLWARREQGGVGTVANRRPMLI